MIETELELDRPDVRMQADVRLVRRGITVTALVAGSDEGSLVVVPVDAGQSWLGSIKPGDPVELYWAGGNEERKLPACIVSVDTSAETQWFMVPTGPAERSQRRTAVRARIELPVRMPWAGGALQGTTIDLSEGGLKCLVDGWGVMPESGTSVPVTLTLDDDVTLDLRGEIAWGSDRGGNRWVLAVRFPDVSEKDGDTLRRRVFRALREERSRAVDDD